jgi:hypothetical protein
MRRGWGVERTRRSWHVSTALCCECMLVVDRHPQSIGVPHHHLEPGAYL